MRMAFATLVLVIYQGLFIDVIARSLCATGSKSIGIATRQPLQSLPTCISIHHFLHPALPFYTLPSARAPRNTASPCDYARWPHFGPIPPMDGGGHLVPLSYVYGYRGGVGRRGVAQDTIGDNGLEIRARVRRYQLILSRCAAGFVPKSAISEISRSGQRKNGRSGGNFLSTARCAWAVLGGIPSGWGQFGAVKKLLSFIGGLRRQLNAL